MMNIDTFPMKSAILSVVLFTLMFGFVACGSPSPAPAAPAAPAAAAPAAAAPSSGMYSEAPMLAEKVASGEIPPVDERLPAEPLVADEWEYVGEYGSVLEITSIVHDVVRRDVTQDWASEVENLTGISGWDNEHLDLQWMRILDGEPLVRWSSDCTIEGNLASSFDINEDGTQFVFHLREGLKWSDGQPFTTEDIVFWYNDVLKNPDLTSSVPRWLMAGEKPVDVEQVDDYTLVFRFDVSDVDFSRWPMPREYFLPWMASTDWPTSFPKHYAVQYHPNYSESDIGQFWEMVGDKRRNPELPTLEAWRAIVPYQELERNPYYWKVDDSGNQLPYIDVIRDFSTVEQRSDTFRLLRRTGCVLFPDIETWIPYPSFPGENVIGPADWVPGSWIMREAILTLRNVLLESKVKINTARTVRLSDEQGTTYLAPHSNPELNKEQLDGAILAVAVIERGSDLKIPPGPYAQRVINQGDDSWLIQYLDINGEVVTEVQMTSDVPEAEVLDNYPSSAIFFGTKKCRTWWEAVGAWVWGGSC